MIAAEIVDRLGQASVQLAVAAAVIGCVGWRLPGGVRAWLWRAAALKAVLALALVAALPLLPTSAESAEVPLAHDLPGVLPMPPGSIETPWASWVLTLWAAGGAVVLGRLVLRVLRAERIARALGKLAPHSSQPNIVSTSAVAAPLILGIGRPTVLVPEQFESPALLAHEFAHAGRRDLLWEVSMNVVCAVFWFHPLAWLALTEHRHACDEAADAVALERTGAHPRDYASALLTYAAAPRVAATTLSAAASSLRRRIRQMQRRRLHPAIIAILIALSAGVLVPVRFVEAQAPSHRPAQAPSLESRMAAQMGDPAIQREIGLDSRQLAKLEALAQISQLEIRRIGSELEQMKRQGVKLQRRVEWEGAEKQAWHTRSVRDRLALLRVEQKEPLRRSALREIGPLALGWKEVGAEAGLSESKIARIASLADEAVRAVGKVGSKAISEHLRRVREGLNLPPGERNRYLALVAKNRKLWDSPQGRAYGATMGLADDDPAKVKAWKAYRAFMDRSPNKLTPEENSELFELTRKAARGSGSGPQTASVKARQELEIRLRSDQAFALLNPSERKAWKRMLGG